MVIAVDGGGSKTDVWAIGLDGTVLAQVTGPGSNPQLIGRERVAELIDELVQKVTAAAGPRPLVRTSIYLSGLDLPVETELFREVVNRRAWSRGVTGEQTVIDNDLLALLRAGTLESDAVALICGTGINCIGVRSDGEVVRFLALGMISGDWGGGWHLGESALWHAMRAEDGRGEATMLASMIPATLGRGSVRGVVEALHFGQIPSSELALLCPDVFAAARAGDAVAGALVDRQAEEIVLMVTAALTRLSLMNRETPIVLGGGVLAAADERLMAGIESRLADRAPLARIRLITAPPIVGAAILALESIGRHEAGRRLAAEHAAA
ncbi:BadF/BadG/BcrA/BcrD ATPase family protein [Leifsonia kafniensis]|uniref:BadF/BadG/BcrA/BcrD ATPase family protein n=2 Tax=Leifsonia kafniensis TaxID=475957 RepID=A0ABP7KZH5_9MICO